VAILLMIISGYSIGCYFKLNYHRILMAIGGVILLTIIGGYSVGGYIGDYFRLNYHRVLVVISGYWCLYY
jgi:hypothetical protein